VAEPAALLLDWPRRDRADDHDGADVRLRVSRQHAATRHHSAHRPMLPVRHVACTYVKEGKGSPYSIADRRVPELIPVLGSQPTGDVSHKPGVRLPLLSTRPAVTSQPLRGLLPLSLLGEQRHDGCEQFA